ncbi:MAG: hypothetical protein JWO53_349 [Chlamydiia bacterium]|nr:hypothetical protein [Chlamydiia bacterium]
MNITISAERDRLIFKRGEETIGRETSARGKKGVEGYNASALIETRLGKFLNLVRHLIFNYVDLTIKGTIYAVKKDSAGYYLKNNRVIDNYNSNSFSNDKIKILLTNFILTKPSTSNKFSKEKLQSLPPSSSYNQASPSISILDLREQFKNALLGPPTLKQLQAAGGKINEQNTMVTFINPAQLAVVVLAAPTTDKEIAQAQASLQSQITLPEMEKRVALLVETTLQIDSPSWKAKRPPPLFIPDKLQEDEDSPQKTSLSSGDRAPKRLRKIFTFEGALSQSPASPKTPLIKTPIASQTPKIKKVWRNQKATKTLAPKWPSDLLKANGAYTINGGKKTRKLESELRAAFLNTPVSFKGNDKLYYYVVKRVNTILTKRDQKVETSLNAPEELFISNLKKLPAEECNILAELAQDDRLCKNENAKAILLHLK